MPSFSLCFGFAASINVLSPPLCIFVSDTSIAEDAGITISGGSSDFDSLDFLSLTASFCFSLDVNVPAICTLHTDQFLSESSVVQ